MLAYMRCGQKENIYFSLLVNGLNSKTREKLSALGCRNMHENNARRKLLEADYYLQLVFFTQPDIHRHN